MFMVSLHLWLGLKLVLIVPLLVTTPWRWALFNRPTFLKFYALDTRDTLGLRGVYVNSSIVDVWDVVHSKLHSITHVATQSVCNIMEFCSVNMDV